MSALEQIDSARNQDSDTTIARERLKSLMLRAWILAGLFFMALPGTLLGFSNLLAISAHRGAAFLPPAWMEGHGHAQVFGWIGSFILGIGFYSQPARTRTFLRVPIACYLLWESGVAMRWIANIYGWHWRVLFPLSAGFELIAVALFLAASSHHKLPGGQGKPRMELWMVSVLLGTAGLTAAVIFNFVECAVLALRGAGRGFPHALDQRYLVLLAWGFIVPVVWGFSARWLHAFLAIAKPSADIFTGALVLNVAGVVCGVSGWFEGASILLASGAVAISFSLHLVDRPHGRAKVQGIHRSFPSFIRIAYLWLVIAGGMSIWAAFADTHGGIWGASRHALTVGFAATMVFAIGPRILPHFGGIYFLFSKGLMFASLLLLTCGCALRVASEPLAYEGVLPFAWKVLPASGVLELSAVLVFAANVALTFAFGKPAFAANTTSQRSAA